MAVSLQWQRCSFSFLLKPLPKPAPGFDGVAFVFLLTHHELQMVVSYHLLIRAWITSRAKTGRKELLDHSIKTKLPKNCPRGDVWTPPPPRGRLTPTPGRRRCRPELHPSSRPRRLEAAWRQVSKVANIHCRVPSLKMSKPSFWAENRYWICRFFTFRPAVFSACLYSFPSAGCFRMLVFQQPPISFHECAHWAGGC